jgi:hypothetical protein
VSVWTHLLFNRQYATEQYAQEILFPISTVRKVCVSSDVKMFHQRSAQARPNIQSSTTFSLTEEAFLLRSLREVVNVWASGSGQATFNLNISNGSADLNLGFQLGLPTESHLNPQHHQHEPVFCPKTPMSNRRKSPSQRRRDRLRAAKHQAAAHQPGQAHHQDPRQLGSAAADSCHTAQTAPDVILPFSISGNLLQIKPTSIKSSKEANVSAPEATPPPSTPPPLVAPKKPPGTPLNVPRRYVDVSSTKKQLFPTATGAPVATPTAAPRTASQPPAAPSRATQPHQLREDQLWTKLFSIVK